ncbi:DUF6245 family protein [Kribbella sp. NPDC056861]|uniref:DUF6245 family protein n=1 Tax=Kribbella sp. NPDC056861 TaxID=3154857 RepID=UPI003422773C
MVAPNRTPVGVEVVTARLANALYKTALVHLMTVEAAGSGAPAPRSTTRNATSPDPDGGVALELVVYTASRLSTDLRQLDAELFTDPGVIAAATEAAAGLALLLEACTTRSPDDPHTAGSTSNLRQAADHLATAADRVNNLLTAGHDTSAGDLITPRPTDPAIGPTQH